MFFLTFTHISKRVIGTEKSLFSSLKEPQWQNLCSLFRPIKSKKKKWWVKVETYSFFVYCYLPKKMTRLDIAMSHFRIKTAKSYYCPQVHIVFQHIQEFLNLVNSDRSPSIIGIRYLLFQKFLVFWSFRSWLFQRAAFWVDASWCQGNFSFQLKLELSCHFRYCGRELNFRLVTQIFLRSCCLLSQHIMPNTSKNKW